jgi:hypothetical protein
MILARRDPNGSMTNSAQAYVDLLVEQANSGVLKSYRIRDTYSRELRAATWDTELNRQTAIEWAKANDIDVSHIE